ncbi:MAG: hypothetical protein ACI4RI_05625 [Ruminococcus sp.]
MDFSKDLTCLAGFLLGEKVYEYQVDGKIDVHKPFTIVFPLHIELITSSFVEGLFSKPLETVGFEVLKENINIKTSSEKLTQDVLDNFINI